MKKTVLAIVLFASLVGLNASRVHATNLAVAISGLSSGATVSGTVSVSAVVQQGDSSASVQFMLDGSSLGSAVTAVSSNGTYLYEWDTTQSANGQHLLYATVTDGSLTATSASVSITIENASSTPLAATITSPAASAVVSGSLTITANATGPYSISSVQFLLNGNDMSTAVSIPDSNGNYDLTWNTTQYQNGNYSLSAVAKDVYGHTSTASPPIQVTVNNALAGNLATISLISPQNNLTVSGTVTISALVNIGNEPITNVQFMLDGTALGPVITVPTTSSGASGGTGSTATYTYAWDTTTASSGGHVLSAVLTDAASDMIISPNVNVTVENLTPTVTFSTPTTGTTVSGSVVVTATVTPNTTTNLAIANVQFTLDGSALGPKQLFATGPNSYSYSWDTTTVTNGTHVLGAIATDQAGRSANASTISVTTSNSDAPSSTVTNPIGTTGASGTTGTSGSAGSTGTSNAPGATPVSGSAHSNNTLIDDNGTFYLIRNDQLCGITNPGILTSLGYVFSQAVPATTGDMQLSAGANVTPNDGALVKTATDPTVYLIADQQRHPFSSAAVFGAQGYSFANVLTVTSPELDALSLGSVISSGSAQHLRGTDIVIQETVFWLDDSSRHPYASTADYNTWHIANDFQTVVPANQADMALPVAAPVVPRS